MKWVLEQHFSELAAIVSTKQYSQMERAAAHLDGLRLGNEASLQLARNALRQEDDPDELIPGVILLAERGSDADWDQMMECLAHDDAEIRNACRIGLRLSSIDALTGRLKNALTSPNLYAAAAAQDVLSFHRHPVTIDLRSAHSSQDAEIQYLTLEAAGRQPQAFAGNDWQLFLDSPSPKVREAALRAACRNGTAGVREVCRSRALERACWESVLFFGLLSEKEDQETLRHLLQDSDTTVAALGAIGKGGWIESLPQLFPYLDSEEHQESAALAFERVTGLSVPRGEPQEPPDHLSEDEKDFWVPVGKPETHLILDWWQKNASQFSKHQRYQEGLDVSPATFSATLPDLSPLVSLDVYLRERALQSQIPDWELETWPRQAWR